jgi:uncharacterized protein (DUF58 family)
MAATPGGESRRYDFPPLWVVPLLLIAGIGLIVWLGLTFGVLGFIAALVGVWWLQRRADAYVRTRESARD